jgi:general secretion pathway protein A
MYAAYYGLREPPFELTPDPRFLFLTPQHREALSNLQYGLAAAKPMTLLIGEAGTGKTTLLRAALESDRCRHVRCVYLSNPVLTRVEFVDLLAREFGLSGRAVHYKSFFLTELHAKLLEERQRGDTTALVVDEAQSLPPDILEEIRLLANFETTRERLLPVVLAGQPELAARLNDPGLRQLKQRVALRCELAPFGLEETASYIASRIVSAGGDARGLFSRDAVVTVHDYSHGIPRTISVICDNALVNGFAMGRRPIERDIVLEVCRDFDLQPVTRVPRPIFAAAPPYEAEHRPAPAPVTVRRRGLTLLGLMR